MYSERHVTQFEYLTQPCSSMKSRTEYGEVGGAAGENSSCTHCHSSVCAENLLARRKDGSSLDWFALPSMCELSRLEYVHSHPMQNTRMNRGAGQLWEGFSAWLVEDELQREYARRRGRGGSANIRKREFALSGLTRRLRQLNRLSTYLHCGKCTLRQ